MAISKEDKHDVQRAYGKALANKVAKVTNDRKHTFAGTGSRKWSDQEAKGISQLVRARGEKDIKEGNYRKLRPVSNTAGRYYDFTNTTKFESTKPKK